jgi:mRNA interferase YafQ
MRNPISCARFKQDVKRMEKRGKAMVKLREVIQLPIEGNPLPPHYKDHPLTGDWKHFRDCHIEPDWLLIYQGGRKRLISGPDRNSCGLIRLKPSGSSWMTAGRVQNNLRQWPIRPQRFVGDELDGVEAASQQALCF